MINCIINFFEYLILNAIMIVIMFLLFRKSLNGIIDVYIYNIIQNLKQSNELENIQIEVENQEFFKYKWKIIIGGIILVFFIHYINMNNEINNLLNIINSSNVEKFITDIFDKDFLTFFKPDIFIFLVVMFFYFRKFLVPKEQLSELEIKIKIGLSIFFIIICFYLLNVENNNLKMILIIIKIFYIIFIYKLWKWKENDIIKKNKNKFLTGGTIITIIYFICLLFDKKNILNSIVILFQDIIITYISVYIEILLKNSLTDSVIDNSKNNNDSNL